MLFRSALTTEPQGRASRLDLSRCRAEGNFLSWPDQLPQCDPSLFLADQPRALTLSAERQWPGDPNNLNRTRQGPGVSKNGAVSRFRLTLLGASTHAEAVRKNTPKFHYIAGCSPAASLALLMRISYGEAWSNISASPNLQPSGGSRRLSWFSAIVGPSSR